MKIPTEGGFYVGLRAHDRNAENAAILREYINCGFRLYASEGTGGFMGEYGIAAETLSFGEALQKTGGEICGLINVPEVANKPGSNSFDIRRKAIERGLPVLTCLDTARVFLEAIRLKKSGAALQYRTLEEYLGNA
jgi:carbamoyl-phosphate synthase large subunit